MSENMIFGAKTVDYRSASVICLTRTYVILFLTEKLMFGQTNVFVGSNFYMYDYVDCGSFYLVLSGYKRNAAFQELAQEEPRISCIHNTF